MLQKLVLYAVLGLVLDAAEVGVAHWAFWCVLALYLALEWIVRRETVEAIERELHAEIERVRKAKESIDDNSNSN
jgi:hypothetical protein